MKGMVELLPVILFFVSYKFYDIYVATIVAMIAAVITAGVSWIHKKKLEVRNIIPLAVIIVFGGATLLLEDPIYIKWKPTVVTWLMGLIFLVSQFIFKKALFKKLMGAKLELPDHVFNRLNMLWGLFFLIIGTVNLVVAYTCDTNTWVNFKLFGVSGMTLIFAVVQSFYIFRYTKANA